MNLSDFRVGDICITVKNDLAVIVSVSNNSDKYPILYKIKANDVTYKGQLDFFKAKVGSISIDLFNKEIVSKPDMWEPRSSIPLVGNVNGKLSTLNTGDKIKVKVRSTVRDGIFKGLDFRKPKNPVLFELDGVSYRCPVDLVVWE